MLELLERQRRLTVNQWKIISAAILGDMLDFFDFFLIGYALAFIVGHWKLTFLESGTILLAAGIGAIPGAFFWGWMADRIGRRKVFVATVLNFSLATGLMAASPDEYGWVFLAFCRLLVGIGQAGMVTVDLPLVQEFVPSSKRGFVGGFVTTTISIGGVLGGAAGTYLGPTIGWRGLFLLGLLPALMTLLIRAWVPESPRWLIRRGRPEEARRSIAWALQSDPNNIQLPAELPDQQHTPWRELFKYPRSVALVCLIGLSQTSGVGLALWGPTLLLLLLKIAPSEAAFLMMWVGVSAFVGRIFCKLFAGPDWAPRLGLPDVSRRHGDPDHRRLFRQRLYRRRLGILVDADGSLLLRRRFLHDHRALHGRSVAGGTARERHGAGLWRRQSRQDHQPAGAGADRRRHELHQAGGLRRGDGPGNAVPRILGGAGGGSVHRSRHRDKGPLDRGNRRGTDGKTRSRQGLRGIAIPLFATEIRENCRFRGGVASARLKDPPHA
jgi:MFS family permease